MQAKYMQFYKTGYWVVFIKLGQKHASKDGIELAFTQQTGISTRGTRFDFRLAVLVLVLAVRTPASACGTNFLARGTGLQASSRRCSRTLGYYYASQIK